jgi:aminopeptidase-like protein
MSVNKHTRHFSYSAEQWGKFLSGKKQLKCASSDYQLYDDAQQEGHQD